MIRFESDYLEGALPQIMYRLMSTNFEQTAGYGCDPYCESARELIKKSAPLRMRTFTFLPAARRPT